MSKLDRLDIKQLRVFQALIREKSASKAANQLGLTQQAVSEQLKKLRDIFEDRLFIRKTNGFIPTPLAENLSVDIDRLLREFQTLLSPRVFDPERAQGTFVIAATDYAQQIVLPHLIQTLRTQSPQLKIIIRDFEVNSIHDYMESGKVNLAISFPDCVPSSYLTMKLFEEQHVCVTSHFSSIPKTSATLKQVAEHPNISASPSRPNFKGSIDDWFEKHDLTRNVVITAPCFSVVPLYLNMTDSLAFLPSRAVNESSLVEIKLDEMPEPFDVIVAWHPRTNDDPLQKWVISKLVQFT